MGILTSLFAGILAAAGAAVRYARRFNGTTDKIVIPPGGIVTEYNSIPGTVNSGKRRSHPVPFSLANGALLLCYTTNQFGARFAMAVCKSTDYGVTFGTSAEVGGNSGGASDTYEGAFAQLSGGTVFFVYGEGTAVKYKLSTDNGDTWGSAVTVDAGAGAQDPHPSVVLDGSTLIVAFAQSNNIYVRRATVTSTTVGAFGSAITVATGTSKDPCVVSTSSGNLTIAYNESTTGSPISIRKSTDSGATWGAAVTITVGIDANVNLDPNLVLFDGVLWLTFSPGTEQTGTYPTVTPGTRYCVAMTSTDAGSTWTVRRVVAGNIYADTHRVNACVDANGDLVMFAAGIDGDTDYHINRLAVNQTLAATIAGGASPRVLDNMTVWTAWAWMYYAGTPNVAQNMQLLTKGGLSAAGAVKRSYISFRDDGTYTNGILGFVERATTNSQYFYNNAIVDNTWTFVAVSYDDARGVGARFRIWTGTTQANLTQRTVSVITEGSGTQTDDTGEPFVVGGRISDNARNFPGDIGGLCGTAVGTLTLAQLQSLMAGTIPSGITLAWASYMSSSVRDVSGAGAAPYLIGGSQAPSGPPFV